MKNLIHFSYRLSMLDYSYQFYIRKYEILKINENNLMAEKRVYILSKR